MSKTRTLAQAVAAAKGFKSKRYSHVSEAHKNNQKAALFAGQTRTYVPVDDEGEQLPDESQLVKRTAENALAEYVEQIAPLLDMMLQIDEANGRAVADIVVGGLTVAKNVPAVTLIALDKQLHDWRDYIDKMPVLDPAYEWSFDVNDGLHKSDPVKASRTKKVQKPIVLYPATEKHPAQTQLITEDVQAGVWTTIKHSGALPAAKKDRLLTRVDQLIVAVKHAREEANASAQISESLLGFGGALFGFLLDS